MLSNLNQINKRLQEKSPYEIINWALSLSKNRIVSTSFGKYSAVLLNAITQIDNDIDVVWCDTGYNTSNTYDHAIRLMNKFNLNISIYSPQKNRAYLDYYYGTPEIDNPKFDEFSEIIKIEPFTRALKEHQPDVWFTNIRANQTKHRNSIGILSFSKDGILKVSPFYHWTDKELTTYIKKYDLQINDSYFDITKVLVNRECGIHLQ